MPTYEQRRMDREGMLFVHASGKVFDLNRVKILHEGVDTIRQLYTGTPKPIINELRSLYEAEIGAIVTLAGERWILGTGGKSGYRFRLQNNHLGLICLYGSRYAKEDQHGSHLKIEVSPHFLYERSPEDVQRELDQVAGALLEDWGHAGLAVHLCLDVQGWNVPRDFEERFVCKAKRKVAHTGISTFEFDGLHAAVRYGDQETITYGAAAGLQFTIYDKTKAALKQDKIHFWEAIWRKRTDENFQPFYQDTDTVRRIELRFHHTVIEQFSQALCQGTDSAGNPCIYTCNQVRNFLQLQPHLTGLWRYGMQSYRLQYTSTTLDPFWQVLLDDIQFNEHRPDIMYRREYKKPGRGAEKNVCLALGNMLSLYVRQGLRIEAIWRFLQRSGIWDDILNYYYGRGLNEAMLRQHIEQAIEVRRLQGRAA